MSHASGPSFDIRVMGIAEIDRISEIDVSERGSVVYKWIDGAVRPVPEAWERPRSYGEGWKRRAEGIRAALSQGGIAFGAFDANQLVGFASLRYHLAGTTAQLQALWVSAPHRRRGIATALVRHALDAARAAGDRSVYLSAIPSESAQDFYRRQGFEPTVFVHRDLYDKEPEDIHMLRQL